MSFAASLLEQGEALEVSLPFHVQEGMFWDAERQSDPGPRCGGRIPHERLHDNSRQAWQRGERRAGKKRLQDFQIKTYWAPTNVLGRIAATRCPRPGAMFRLARRMGELPAPGRPIQHVAGAVLGLSTDRASILQQARASLSTSREKNQRGSKTDLQLQAAPGAVRTAAHVGPSRRGDEQPFFRSDIRTDFELSHGGTSLSERVRVLIGQHASQLIGRRWFLSAQLLASPPTFGPGNNISTSKL